jgi:glycosyltransferase involved in cell wall biosynthesis
MRIALDARYIREKPSGIGVYVQALVDRLPPESPSDQFTLWAHAQARRPLSDAPNVRDIVVTPGPNAPGPLFWPRRYASFAGIDLFHSPHNILARGVPCPTVVTVQDTMAIDHPGMHLQGLERLALSWYYRQAVWRALRRATRLIVTTRATADRVRALMPGAASRLHVIALAADSCFRPASDSEAARRRAAAIVGTDDPFVLIVGADAPAKRHHLALTAFAAAVPRPARLVCLQRPAAYDHQRRLARLKALAHDFGVEDRVIWMAQASRSDVVTLLQTADALLQPSVYEGFGLPVLEAMACGCPVVATDIPPFREIAGAAAVLVTPDDVNALTTAVREVTASASHRQSMAALGLERAGAYSWDRCARETLEVYHATALC